MVLWGNWLKKSFESPCCNKYEQVAMEICISSFRIACLPLPLGNSNYTFSERTLPVGSCYYSRWSECFQEVQFFFYGWVLRCFSLWLKSAFFELPLMLKRRSLFRVWAADLGEKQTTRRYEYRLTMVGAYIETKLWILWAVVKWFFYVCF